MCDLDSFIHPKIGSQDQRKSQFYSNLSRFLLIIKQNVLGTVKILILVFIVLTGLFLLTFGIATVPNPGASFKDPFVGSSRSSYDYALALFKVIATYAGWSNASYVLNEVKNPVQTLKIAGPLGLGVVGLLYGLANIAFFAAATPQEIGESGVTVAALFLGKVFGEGARRVAGVFVATSALGNIMTVTFSLSRVDQELTKEGMLPFSRFWASNWPTGSPSAALFLVFFYTSFIIVAVPFGKILSLFQSASLTLPGDAYNFILDVMGYPFAFTSVMVTIGLFILRRRARHLERSFRIWLPLAFFFLATQVFLIVTPLIRPANGKGDTSLPYWLPPVVGITFVLGGILYWAVWRVGLPLLGGFSWVTQETHLQDGTTVIVWARSKSSALRKKNRFW
jgi:amino acid transporter